MRMKRTPIHRKSGVKIFTNDSDDDYTYTCSNNGNKRHYKDVDVIEALWKQDVDLGFTLPPVRSEPQKSTADDEDEKLRVLQSLKNDSTDLPIKDEEIAVDEETEKDPWAGLSYTVDLETGEYILKDEFAEPLDIKEEIARDLGLGDELTESLSETNGQSSVTPELPCLSLEEALRLAGLDDPSPLSQSVNKKNNHDDDDYLAAKIRVEEEEKEDEGHVSDEGDFLTEMIQTAQFHPPHPPHPRAFQSRMPLVRTMSMEQRWQDLANLLSLPGHDSVSMHAAHAHHAHFAHHGPPHPAAYGAPPPPPPPHPAYPHDARGVLLHNASLAPPVGDLPAATAYTPVSMGSSNLGSAVATSMNLTNSSEPMGDTGPVFKMEAPHDLIYYQNSTQEMNQSTEGFLSSILNDEDLQLMDMAMTEGMYPMRLLESNSSQTTPSTATPSNAPTQPEERLDASSDSAVSSMGSERVPSLSDGEWMETGSDSGHTNGDHYHVDYYSKNRGAYDYSYSGRHVLSGNASTSADPHIPPVAQKKHHMFAKRYFQEQGSTSGSSLASHRLGALASSATPIKYEYDTSTADAAGAVGYTAAMDSACAKLSEAKYSCSLDFIRQQQGRNSLEQIHHNHTYTLPGDSSLVRLSQRDKARRKTEEEHLTRDEKRAAAMNIPLPVDDIVNLPMDEFNERLSKFDLSEAQLSLIRDIRRRGKNKVAAQNCRKRKLDQIVSLADEVRQMKDRKNRLLRDREVLLGERHRVKERFSQLYRHVFQALRDPEGNQYSPYEFSLQQSADGTVVLVPRSSSASTSSSTSTSSSSSSDTPHPSTSTSSSASSSANSHGQMHTHTPPDPELSE